MEMPVDQVVHELAHMWDNLGDMEANVTDSRASQLNLVLHMGLGTSPSEAQELFEICLSFARTYPCRLVVLCPSEERIEGFEGKLFSQCYVGEHLREACCCEALILGYSIDNSDFLENQVSVWLESDLPVYHWFHRVPAERISRYYLDYLKRCRRVIYDGEVEGRQLYHIDWPNPKRVRDLAYSRTLPLRQHLGQFLGGFDPGTLVEGLVCLRIQYHKGRWSIANHLMDWHKKAVKNCHENPATADSIKFTVEQLVEERSRNCLFADWEYSTKDKFIRWSYEQSLKVGEIRTRIDGEEFDHPLHIEPMRPEKVLAETLFFH